MATFFGGEQLSQVLSLTNLINDVDQGEKFLIYTIPTGYYGFLKFAYCGRNDANYPSGVFAGSVILHFGKEVNPDGTQGEGSCFTIVASEGDSGGTSLEPYAYHKYAYRPSVSVGADPSGFLIGGNYDLYLESESKFYLQSATLTNNNSIKWELEIHLYKKP